MACAPRGVRHAAMLRTAFMVSAVVLARDRAAPAEPFGRLALVVQLALRRGAGPPDPQGPAAAGHHGRDLDVLAQVLERLEAEQFAQRGSSRLPPARSTPTEPCLRGDSSRCAA